MTGDVEAARPKRPPGRTRSITIIYEFSAGEHGVTFRLGDRGVITVKETTLTWTPAGGGSPQTAKLVPLSDQ